MTSPNTAHTSPPPPRVLAIVGPTAVGKTALAENLSVRVGGEIVSADSMQVYRGMDIGTSKPAASQRAVPYHCIDVVEPGEPFSAALFQQMARTAIDDCMRRGRTAVVCGGTGLYVRAALDDWRFPPGEQSENPARAEYERIAEEQGAMALHALLSQRDPASAQLLHPNNVRRVVRALEMLDSGASYARQQAGFSERTSVYDVAWLGLTMDRAALYARIDARVDAMMSAGLVREVESLLERGFRTALTAASAIGYKELVGVIESGEDLSEAVLAIKQATRRYAKRQLTWFRADPRIVWLDVSALAPEAAVEAALGALDLTPGV